MDEEDDHGSEDVNAFLAQESQQLFNILSAQSSAVIMKLCQMIPGEAGWPSQQVPVGPCVPAGKEHINIMLEYFKTARATECCIFLQSVCMLCDNIPMSLESRLMSMAGSESSSCEISAPDVNEPNLPPWPSAPHLTKRPRIDHWEQYIAAVKSSMLRRWERLTEGLVREVQLENVWVSPRMSARSRDKPDQTPGRTPEPDGDYGSLESRMTLETFLHGCAGKVTVLVGRAGSGKTFLMSLLGQQWSQGLGPIPSTYLFVLLEFRQLNLLSNPLLLSELLFQHYFPSGGSDDAKRAIVDYLFSNPEQSCWVLDGYDEFQGKLTRQEVQGKQIDLENPLPVASLISGLLNRQLLPGSTVLVTCRARDVLDLDGISDKVGQLLGWDHYEIKEYVENFFGVKGQTVDTAVGEQAAELLLSNRHLLAMSSIPALCNICCICLEHLLLQGRATGEVAGRGGNEEKNKTLEKCNTVQNSDNSQKLEQNGKDEKAKKLAQIPTTVTQVYFTVLSAFLSRNHRRDDTPQATRFPQSNVSMLTTINQYQSELCELSRVAWSGLEESKILFLEEDIPRDVLVFSLRTGLFSQVELRHQDGVLINAYCFIHLTMQEFLAALRIMTSNDVSDAELKKRFSLKTRWTTKSDQKTVFTDSLYLYVCGLASSHCIPTLVQLARAAGRDKSWVQKRQALVLKLLKTLCNSNTLTGPKILQLCHCVQETQDHQLAKQIVDARPILELRNIWLLPNDTDALAFVVNSGGDNGVGLDFGACSMELECLDGLSKCQHIHSLRFHSRKYDDKFAEKLSSVLPEFKTLRKLEFCGASLTATGAASLASGLQNCPGMTEINLSDNNLKDEGIQHICEIFTKIHCLVSVILGRNNTSLKAVECLIEKMSSCSNILHVHADGIKELTVTFSPNPEIASHKTFPAPTLSLLNQKWSQSEMQKIAKSLIHCPALSVLDLSGGQWDEHTLKMLIRFLPKFNITEKIILNESCSSVEGLALLAALLPECPTVVELHIRLEDPVQAFLLFSSGEKKPAEEIAKKLSLSCCNLLPADLEKLLTSLRTSSGLSFLDLSGNSLRNKGLGKLLEVLPHLSKIQEINISNNGINMEGVGMLAGALCSQSNLTQIYISDGGKDKVILKFCPDKSDAKQQRKIFRINNSSLLPSNVTKVCQRLVQCRSHLELDLSHSSLTENALLSLLKMVPNMTTLQRLSVSITFISEALILVSCLADNKQVTSADLSPQMESFLSFGAVKAEHVSCRLTHFRLTGENMQRLLELLQRSPHLSDLDLSSNEMKDEGVKCLLDFLPRLKISSSVNLSNNGLTSQGLLHVATTLCTIKNVSGVEFSSGEEQRCLIWLTQNGDGEKTLSIRESSLERDHLMRLGEIVSSCPSPAKLEFINNSLHSDWIEEFVKLLTSSQGECMLSIEEYWIRKETAVHLLCRCLELSPNIQMIRINRNTLHLSLVKSTELTSVSLVDCEVEGYQLTSLENIIRSRPSLTELNFSQNSLGIEGAAFLSFSLPLLPNLSSLSIESKESIPDVVEELSQALLQSKSIQHLNLSGHVISDKAADSISRVFPQIQSLNLSHCGWSEGGGLQLMKALGMCISLEVLCIERVQLNEDSRMSLAKALRNIRSIHCLKLNEIVPVMGESDSGLDILAAMEGLREIEEIELDNWRMANRGTEQLIRQLPTWKKLRKLSLSKNCVSDQSGEKLIESLEGCVHLEELHLSNNNLGNLSAAKMAVVLPSLTNLRVLDISQNHMKDEGTVSLSKVVKSMKNLNKINLTSVGMTKLYAVVASLVHCPFIQDISLGWNNSGDDVALELARVLPLCRRVTRIDLESNSVSVAGAEALLRALRSCPAVQLIRLWKNKMSQSEAQRLSHMDRRLNFSST
ncbi:protein NLRC5 isoform 2-T2 [Pholidichthys leucotaenia]